MKVKDWIDIDEKLTVEHKLGAAILKWLSDPHSDAWETCLIGPFGVAKVHVSYPKGKRKSTKI